MNLHSKVFRAAINDKLFVADILATDNHLPSKWFADDLEKGVYGSCYIGWLIGKYGPELGNKMYLEIKHR